MADRQVSGSSQGDVRAGSSHSKHGAAGTVGSGTHWTRLALGSVIGLLIGFAVPVVMFTVHSAGTAYEVGYDQCKVDLLGR